MLFKAAKEKFIAISTVVALTLLVSSQRELEIASRSKNSSHKKWILVRFWISVETMGGFKW